MGLDVYAVRPDNPAVTTDAERQAVGGVRWDVPADLAPFKAVPRGGDDGLGWPSDGDFTGFRGKNYQEWVDKTFGVSLYQLLEPTEVRELAEKAGAWHTNAVAEGLTEVELGEGYSRPLGEVGNLVRYLREAADQGLWLYPDY